MSKATEEAHLDAFHIGFETANDGIMIASFLFAEQLLMKMAQNGASNKVFSRNTERRDQSSTFMYAFVRSALMSSWFVRPVTKLGRKNLEEQSD